MFRLNTDGTGYTVLKHFNDDDGSAPWAGVTLFGGKLYGTTSSGGSSLVGTVFKLNTDGTGFSVLKHFARPEGYFSLAGVTVSGKMLYGTTVFGGDLDVGTVFRIALPHEPPVAVIHVSPSCSAWETNLFILSPNNISASVVLDGSSSTDADNDPLSFSWFELDAAHPFAEGVRTTNLMAVGEHTITLEVSDGQYTTSTSLSFEVIGPSDALSLIYLSLERADEVRYNKSLSASLEPVMAAFDKGRFQEGANILQGLIHKAQAQLAPTNPLLADQLICLSRQIIAAVGQGQRTR